MRKITANLSLKLILNKFDRFYKQILHIFFVNLALNPVQNENRISVLGRKLPEINMLCQTSLFEKPGFHCERGLVPRIA